MSEHDTNVSEVVDHLFRTEYGKLVAVLAARFGMARLGAAEDLVQETLIAAMRTWPHQGVPDNPAAWLMTVAKNKAKNVLAHVDVKERKAGAIAQANDDEGTAPSAFLRTDVEDDLLRMIFAVCHPHIALPDQIALVLKTLCGFSTREVAHALLVSDDAVTKRLYRAKQTIKENDISLEPVGGAALDERQNAVARCLYLVFNEGYLSATADDGIRADLCAEAIRLLTLVVNRSPRADLKALLALMYFHAARLASRVDDSGALVLLAEQDRSVWSREHIEKGLDYLHAAASGDVLSTYHLEASIAAQHCLAPSLEETNWPFICALYEKLFVLTNNPLVNMTLAIARAQMEGPARGIELLDAMGDDRVLMRHAMFYVAQAEFCRQAGRCDDARGHYETALALQLSPTQRHFVEAALDKMATEPH